MYYAHVVLVLDQSLIVYKPRCTNHNSIWFTYVDQSVFDVALHYSSWLCTYVTLMCCYSIFLVLLGLGVVVEDKLPNVVKLVLTLHHKLILLLLLYTYMLYMYLMYMIVYLLCGWDSFPLSRLKCVEVLEMLLLKEVFPSSLYCLVCCSHCVLCICVHVLESAPVMLLIVHVVNMWTCLSHIVIRILL